MVPKILAGVFAAAVLSVSGYVYWQYTAGTLDAQCAPCGSAAEDGTQAAACCVQPTRSTLIELSSCCGDEPTVTPEVLTIAPREVN